MKLNGGLAWLGVIIFGVGTLVETDQFGLTVRPMQPMMESLQQLDRIFDSSHHEPPSIHELFLGLSSCKYSVTGGLIGPLIAPILTDENEYRDYAPDSSFRFS